MKPAAGADFAHLKAVAHTAGRKALARAEKELGTGYRVVPIAHRTHSDNSAHCGQCREVPSYTLTLIKVRPDGTMTHLRKHRFY